MKREIAIAVFNMGAIAHLRSDLDGAMTAFNEAARIHRELGDKNLMANSLAGKGVILRALGRRREALEVYADVEHICLELGFRNLLQYTLGNQALVLSELNSSTLDGKCYAACGRAYTASSTVNRVRFCSHANTKSSSSSRLWQR